MRSLSPTTWLALIAFVFSAAFYAWNVTVYVDQPLRIEESEFVPMARAVARHGEPVIEVADGDHRRFVQPDATLTQQGQIGAWHPPLYLYALGADAKLFGSSTVAMRGLGVVGLLLTAWLLFLIARELAGERWLAVGAGANALLFVAPYATQGSMFIDIDTSVYAPVLMLLMWLVVRATNREERLPVRWILILGAAFALVLWTKMTTAVAVVGVLGIWFLLARRLRGLIEVIGILASGGLMFLATYALWCSVADIPFSYTFDVTFGAKGSRFMDAIESPASLHWFTAWLTPVLLLLVLMAVIDAVRSFLATRRLRQIDLLLMFGLAVMVLYIWVAPTAGVYKGKYVFPALPALVLPVASLALREEQPVRLVRLALAGLVALAALYLLPDLIVDQRWFIDPLVPSFDRWLAIGLSAAALLIAGALTMPAPRRLIPLGALLTAWILMAGQSVRSARSDLSPLYPFTDTAAFEGAVRTARMLADEPGDIVFTTKELGYYLPGPVVEGEAALFAGDAATAEFLAENRKVVAAASTSFGPPMGPETVAVLDRCFKPSYASGRTLVRERKPGKCTPPKPAAP